MDWNRWSTHLLHTVRRNRIIRNTHIKLTSHRKCIRIERYHDDQRLCNCLRVHRRFERRILPQRVLFQFFNDDQRQHFTVSD